MTNLSILFNVGMNLAESLIFGWDDTWEKALTGSLYEELCKVGTIIAVGTLLFLMVQLFRDFNEGKMGSLGSLSQLIWPLLVAFLLANNGRVLAEVTLEIRDIINQINDAVLDAVVDDINLDKLFRQALVYIGLKSMVSSFLQPCQSFLGEAQQQCLDQGLAQTQGLATSVQSLVGNASWLGSFDGWLTDVRGGIGNDEGDGLMGLLGVLTPSWLPIVASLLTWIQTAYQQSLEASLLLTALLGPLAVGASLLPNGTKLSIVWVTTLFSIGFARLSFNLLVGVTSIIVTSGGGNPFWFTVFGGLFAPLISATLAGGSGFGIVSAARKIPSFSLNR